MSILQTIVERKRLEVECLPKDSITAAVLQKALTSHGPRRDFLRALEQPKHKGMALIAEVKKASPSAGVICPDFDPVRIATAYQGAGADCLSVLTDEPFFQGSLEYLQRIRQHVRLPLLRKDFIIDARQILEALQWGADAILLIVAILADGQLREYLALAEAANLAALVEVHDEAELDRALAAGARLIGVNNRDLRTFQVDLGTTERLAARLRAAQDRQSRHLVGESGIHTRADVERLARAGAKSILVGESLIRHGNIPAKVSELLGEMSRCVDSGASQS